MSAKLDLMLDLETMGNGSRAAIRAIGAVFFDKTGLEEPAFYVKVDLQSCVDAGLEMDVDTVLWWLGQSEDARAEMRAGGGMSLAEALMEFRRFIGGREVRVWGNGASFDNAIMASAHRAVRLPLPWKFWNDRCYRTMKALRPEVKLSRDGTHHNALSDARSQAMHLAMIWRDVA